VRVYQCEILPNKKSVELESRYGIESDDTIRTPMLHQFHFGGVTLFHESGWMSAIESAEETWRQVKVVRRRETKRRRYWSEYRDSLETSLPLVCVRDCTKQVSTDYELLSHTRFTTGSSSSGLALATWLMSFVRRE
jgi:hypothetical protein